MVVSSKELRKIVSEAEDDTVVLEIVGNDVMVFDRRYVDWNSTNHKVHQYYLHLLQ